jgi:hypothetical protein
MVGTFREAHSWLMNGGTTKPHLLLGNGFSMAYDRDRFSYSALSDQAEAEDLLPASAQQLMEVTGSRDFEAALRQLEATADTLEALDPVAHAATIQHLRDDIGQLREALAQAVAGLHPDRPYDIDDAAYVRVRRFLDAHKSIYSVSYDLLTYWTLMQDVPDATSRRSDGFRDSGVAGDETVLWDIYEPYGQSVHYLHGALHVFLGPDGLRKITYSRTGLPLIEQVREQLALRRYPLYVAEGESASKMTRINTSAYLARALRSLSSCQGSCSSTGTASTRTTITSSRPSYVRRSSASPCRFTATRAATSTRRSSDGSRTSQLAASWVAGRLSSTSSSTPSASSCGTCPDRLDPPERPRNPVHLLPRRSVSRRSARRPLIGR